MDVRGRHLGRAPRRRVHDPHRRVARGVEVAEQDHQFVTGVWRGPPAGCAADDHTTSAQRACSSAGSPHHTSAPNCPAERAQAKPGSSPVTSTDRLAHQVAVRVGVVGVAAPRDPPRLRGRQCRSHGPPVPEVLVRQRPSDRRHAGPMAESVPDGGPVLAVGGELRPDRCGWDRPVRPSAASTSCRRSRATKAFPTE